MAPVPSASLKRTFVLSAAQGKSASYYPRISRKLAGAESRKKGPEDFDPISISQRLESKTPMWARHEAAPIEYAGRYCYYITTVDSGCKGLDLQFDRGNGQPHRPVDRGAGPASLF
jgi:hypothetical protein